MSNRMRIIQSQFEKWSFFDAKRTIFQCLHVLECTRMSESSGKKFLQFLEVLSPSWYFVGLRISFSCVQGPTWYRVRDCRNQKTNMFDREIAACKSTSQRVFIPLKKMVSLPVLAYFSVIPFTDCTQKVPLFNLESPNDILPGFFSWDSWCFCCTHLRIWAPRDLGAHSETGSNLILDFPLVIWGVQSV